MNTVDQVANRILAAITESKRVRTGYAVMRALIRTQAIDPGLILKLYNDHRLRVDASLPNNQIAFIDNEFSGRMHYKIGEGETACVTPLTLSLNTEAQNAF